jgi:hypothetical protein
LVAFAVLVAAWLLTELAKSKSFKPLSSDHSFRLIRFFFWVVAAVIAVGSAFVFLYSHPQVEGNTRIEGKTVQSPAAATVPAATPVPMPTTERQPPTRRETPAGPSQQIGRIDQKTNGGSAVAGVQGNVVVTSPAEQRKPDDK